MNSSLVLAVLLALAGLALAKIDYEEAEKQFNTCKAETKAEESFDEVYKNKKIPTSDAGMCLVECMFRQKGIYDDKGEYNEEGTKKYFNKVFSHKPENIEKSIKISKDCYEENKDDQLDKCELAVKRVTCVRAKTAKEGIKLDD